MPDLLTLIVNAINALPAPPDAPSNRSLQTAASGAATRVATLLGRPVHIPSPATDPSNPAAFESFKSEVVVFDDPDRGTIKVNYWSGDDPRPEPHDHPWDDGEGVAFRSTIIQGGYSERLTCADGTEEVRTFRAGDVNTMPEDGFHTVFDVLPDTVSLMVCGPRRNRPEGEIRWGYLIDDGNGGKEYVDMNHPQVRDATFFARFTLLNPHRRPAGVWDDGLPASLVAG